MVYRRFIVNCVLLIAGCLVLQAQQEGFDPVLPPDPDASYSVTVISDPADAAVLTGGGAPGQPHQKLAFFMICNR